MVGVAPVIATTNFSSMCSHGWGSGTNAAFIYKQTLPSPAATYVSYAYLKEATIWDLAGTATANITWNQLADVFQGVQIQ